MNPVARSGESPLNRSVSGPTPATAPPARPLPDSTSTSQSTETPPTAGTDREIGGSGEPAWNSEAAADGELGSLLPSAGGDVLSASATADTPSEVGVVTEHLGGDEFWVALGCSLFAAVGYTAANGCLRAAVSQDPVWVSCVKTFPTVLLAVPWLIFRCFRGQALLRHPHDAWYLVAAGAIGHLLGNVLFQTSLQYVGLAISVPLTLGTIIFMGAILGHWVLGDHMNTSKVVAGMVLVGAIVILAQGAQAVRPPVATASSVAARSTSGITPSSALVNAAENPTGYAWWGAAAALTSGLSYSSLGLAIRYTGRRGMHPSTTLSIISVVGLIALTMTCWARLGEIPWSSTSSDAWRVMWGAGIFNAVAFLAFTKALHTGSIFFVNGVNATQTAMAAVLGIWLFGEPLTTSLLLGVLLTSVGLVLMSRKS